MGCCDQGNKFLVAIKMSNFLSSSIVVRFAGRSLSHGILYSFLCLFGWDRFPFS
jgi:hypothetical protein